MRQKHEKHEPNNQVMVEAASGAAVAAAFSKQVSKPASQAASSAMQSSQLRDAGGQDARCQDRGDPLRWQC